MGVICCNFQIIYFGYVKLGGIKTVVGNFHGVEGILGGNLLDAFHRFSQIQIIVGRMVEDKEILSVSFYPADMHVSFTAMNRQFNAGKDEEIGFYLFYFIAIGGTQR